jgi:hypothetical protein
LNGIAYSSVGVDIVDWAEWKDYLWGLVGLEAGRRKVDLLVPKLGRNDLSEKQGEELALVVHRHLFSSYSSANYQLQKLIDQEAKESLPLLYFSAWLARQQEDAHAFWPPFCESVVRNKLSDQTVQQSLAPLISALWTKAHLELGIYRPQEGRVHVKWPQAHAGLTEGEIQLLSQVLARNIGIPDEPPDELYGEPSEFLALLRIWLQSESHVSRRLKRLIFGQDGPASVVAELAQKLLLESWPPDHISEVAPPVKKVSPPSLRLDLHPVRLSVVVPAGSVPGYAILQAHYESNKIPLDTSYSERTSVTSYKSYEWPVVSIPWSSEVYLVGYESQIRMRVVPECPLSRGQLGLIMFDPVTGRCVRRWRPNHHYWLFARSTNIPTWLDKLFADIETEDAGSVAGIDVIILSAVGRDLIKDLGKDETLHVLREIEEELNKSAALITLPDYGELLQPELTFCGGLPITQGRYFTYVAGHSPIVAVRNISESGVALYVYNRDASGHEFIVASVSLDGENHPDSVILELPPLDDGFYVIRGLNEPSFFSLTSELPRTADVSMDVTLRLLQSDEAINIDDMRHFESRGIEITSWPYARVMFKVSTEAGSNTYPIRMGSDGKRIIRAHDVDFPQTAKWAKIQANAWLAVSQSIELALRPYVVSGEWSIEGGKLVALVRGVNPGTEFLAISIPERSWDVTVFESHGEVGVDCRIDVDVPVIPTLCWVMLMDSEYSGVWLFSRIGESDVVYNIQDFRKLCSKEFSLPCYLTMVEPTDASLRQMCCLVRLAALAQHAKIPLADQPLSDSLIGFVNGLQPTDLRSIQLDGKWLYKKATMERIDSFSHHGFLEVEGRRFRVYVDPSEQEIRLTWLESSGPCICGSCGQIMTQEQWFSHNDGNSLTLLGREFTAEPLMDWPSVIELVELSLLNAIGKKSVSAPNGLDVIWASLQDSFRKSNRRMSPKEWVEGIFSSWRNLFYLVNSEESEHDWTSIWRAVEPYNDALTNLEIGKQ